MPDFLILDIIYCPKSRQILIHSSLCLKIARNLMIARIFELSYG